MCKFFKYLLDIKWQGYELGIGMKRQLCYRTDPYAGECLSSIVGCYMIAILIVACPLMWINNFHLLTSVIFFYLFMLFLKINDYQSNYNNWVWRSFSTWATIISISLNINNFKINDIDIGLGITFKLFYI